MPVLSGHDFVVGIVGKPSAGKSTFFNAVTDGGKTAKTASYPFTTIQPNVSLSYYRTPCPCKPLGKQCSPNVGFCRNGTRFVPVKLLDVAGLIPGASTGAGLGNKFLDDLRHAQVLVHVIDVSGKTDAEGKETTNYDASQDVAWLLKELEDWVHNNVWSSWHNLTRRQLRSKLTAVETLQPQFSGYGVNVKAMQEVLSAHGVHDPVDLSSWKEEDVRRLVERFIAIRFPMVLLLNKGDMSGATGKNIEAICKIVPEDRVVVGSALSEVELRKLAKENKIYYPIGEDTWYTAEDLEDPLLSGSVPEGVKLKELDEKTKKMLDKLQGRLMLRFGSTGVWTALQTAIGLLEPVVAYPVSNITNLIATPGKGDILGTAVVLQKGATPRNVAAAISTEMASGLLYGEGVDGRRIAADEPLGPKSTVVKLTVAGVKAQKTGGGLSQGSLTTGSGDKGKSKPAVGKQGKDQEEALDGMAGGGGGGGGEGQPNPSMVYTFPPDDDED